MVTYAQLRNMDFSRLSGAASASGGLSGNLSSRGSEVSTVADIPAGMWAGADAGAAGSLLSPLSSPLFDASDAFRHVQGVLETLVDGLTAAKNRLDDAHELAAGTGIVINDDGSITVPPSDSPAVANRNLEALRQIKQIIDEALRMADEVDGLAAVEIENQRPLGDIVDVWGGGEAKLDKDGLNLGGNAGIGWKEGLKLGENGEYGTVTGLLGAEVDGKLQVGPNGVGIGAGGFAGGSLTYQTPGIDVGPGDTEFSGSVTPRYGVGAEADLGISYEDGKFNFKPKVGVAWGPGLSIGTDISIDVPATIDSLGDAAGSVRELIPGL